MAPSTSETAASTSSSANSLGTATAAASLIAGWAQSSVSTSKDEMFSPRRRIASFMRSTKKNCPSSPTRKASPVWNQPLRHALAVASGFL